MSEARSLPPGWSKVESRSKPGKFYWFNENTGETSWKFPQAAKPKSARPLPQVPDNRNTGNPPPASPASNVVFHKKKMSSLSRVPHASRANQTNDGVAAVMPSGALKYSSKPAVAARPKKKVIKFTAKLVVLEAVLNLSSKATHHCELSLWRMLGTEQKIAQEDFVTDSSDGKEPEFMEKHEFGGKVTG